jgi:hypothetical protein
MIRGKRFAGVARLGLLCITLAVFDPAGSAVAARRKMPLPIPRPAAASVQKSDGISPLAEAKSAFAEFRTTPFPYRGIIPDKDKPFIDIVEDGRRGHTSPRAGVYWEDETYSDRRVLIFLPKAFDLRRPAVIVVFFHGNDATLARDVIDRQRVPDQVANSGLNAILVVPQFALDAKDSSAGNFWRPGVFARFLDEASGKIAEVYGAPDKRKAFARLPVVLLAYSGGYNPAAFAVALGGANKRVVGVMLLDAIYAEEDKFADWIARHRKAFFFSAYSDSSKPGNDNLARLLDARHIAYERSPPAQLTPGSVTFLAADPETPHEEFVTAAWVTNPVQWLLSRIPGYPR